jgi:hypothetical protein
MGDVNIDKPWLAPSPTRLMVSVKLLLATVILQRRLLA